MAETKVQYVLTGFREDQGSRVYSFDGIGADRTRTAYTVAIDLALSRRYGIRLQELPLLCRAVLERPHEDEGQRAYRYTEADMSRFAGEAAARQEAARKKAPPRPAQRPPSPWNNR